MRLQTWFPFTVHVGMNGREWLARQMDQSRHWLTQRRDNCFAWNRGLVASAATSGRAVADRLGGGFWVACSSKPTRRCDHRGQASDAVLLVRWRKANGPATWRFVRRRRGGLAPCLFRHGADCYFDSGDVMSLLGKQSGDGPGVGHPMASSRGKSSATSSVASKATRIKHRLNGNWIKMYDKQGSVLRVETVINDPRDMKCSAPKRGR